jgi:hypothetical protein
MTGRAGSGPAGIGTVASQVGGTGTGSGYLLCPFSGCVLFSGSGHAARSASSHEPELLSVMLATVVCARFMFRSSVPLSVSPDKEPEVPLAIWACS